MPGEADPNAPNTEGGIEGQQQAPTSGNGQGANNPRGQFMAPSTIAALKKEQRERGMREALTKLDAEAKAAGFNSYEEMKQAAAQAKRAPASRPQQQAPAQGGQSNGASRREAEAYQRQIKELEDRVRTLQKENSRLAKKAREIERTSLEKQGELELHLSAVKAGVKDPDVAVALLRKSIPQRMEGEDNKAYHDRLAKFDEAKYWDQLREQRPYLFGEQTAAPAPVVKPASTGNGSGVPATKQPGANPAPPAPPANGSAKNARDMSPAELRKRMEELGLDPTLAD
jgi:hypothetical protein